MNGEMAQIIFLVSHGNACLHDPETLIADHSTRTVFQYVSSLDFTRYETSEDTTGQVVAGSASQWFAFLRSIQASRLWNVSFEWSRSDIPEHVAVAFSGGVPSAIQADLPHGHELWVPHWKTGGPDKMPWMIEYRGHRIPKSLIADPLPMSVVINNLRKAVTRASEFSRRAEFNGSNWSDRFSQSLEMLDSQHPNAPYHPDLLPEEGYSRESHQLLASAAEAFVFGGMGSWNDMGFGDPKTQNEYDRITSELYAAVKCALITASNSFFS